MAKAKPKPKRERTARRQTERTLRKEVQERQQLTLAGPGGSRDGAFAVSTPAVIEGRARSEPCLQCGGELELRRHAAEGPRHRVINLVCRRCHAPREIWFRIESVLAN